MEAWHADVLDYFGLRTHFLGYLESQNVVHTPHLDFDLFGDFTYI